MSHLHAGGCHCGALGLELATTRLPRDQIIGACQCSFCRKHNARTFSDPGARAVLTIREPGALSRYAFGLRTAEAVICGRCGVYVAMLLRDGAQAWTTINVDELDERAAFDAAPQPRDFSAESTDGRLERRKARWIPTRLVGWPAEPS